MSVSQTSNVPVLSGGTIDINTIKNPTRARSRRTKIVCTLGPACWEVPQLEKLIDAGMSVARFNFSHGDHSGHKACLDRLRQAAKNKDHHVAVMLDTKGPEIRSGFFANDAKKICLVKGESIVLTTDYSFKGDNTKLACSYAALPSSVTVGQSILVADGSLVLTVLSIDEAAGEITCRIENNAAIGERKNMNLPGVIVDLPTLTEKDISDIVDFGIKNDVDFIAASFVRKGSDVGHIRKILADNGGQHIKIICKIENLEGLENYNSILRLTDAIMVARGDLGMEIPPEKVFLAQKMMIREANLAGKPVITATQMLESMITNPRPTRAECSDVANAVYDGTDCVMLSGETANGPYFEEAVKVMANTCIEAESSINFDSLYQAVRNSSKARYQMANSDSLASSAVKTAIDIGAKLILILSESGNTARQVSKFRPSIPIAVLTPSEAVARQTNGILKGCYSFVVDSLEDTDAIVQEVNTEIVSHGIAKEGDLFVCICGTSHGMGANNQVKVERVLSNYWEETGESDMAAHQKGREAHHEHLEPHAGEAVKGCSLM
jgi:pyruvate kinase